MTAVITIITMITTDKRKTSTGGKPPKKAKSQAMSIMLTELRSMLPTFWVCNAVAAVVCVIWCIINVFEWQLLNGLFLGNFAAIANFYALGAKSARVIRSKDKRKAQVYTASIFMVRYLGAFALFGVLIKLGLINPYTAVMPLFFPRIHYTYKAIFNKL